MARVCSSTSSYTLRHSRQVGFGKPHAVPPTAHGRIRSYPDGNTWYVIADHDGGGNWSVTAYAVCVAVA